VTYSSKTEETYWIVGGKPKTGQKNRQTLWVVGKSCDLASFVTFPANADYLKFHSPGAARDFLLARTDVEFDPDTVEVYEVKRVETLRKKPAKF
jgi:hypothetical protein